MVEVALNRQAAAERGKRLEYFTVAWNSLEGLVALIAGGLAGSISLVGFGIDSYRGYIWRHIALENDRRCGRADPRTK